MKLKKNKKHGKSGLAKAGEKKPGKQEEPVTIDGVKVLTIGKEWKLHKSHKILHLNETSHLEEVLATFRPDVIITSTWVPGMLKLASHEIRKRWIHVPPDSKEDDVRQAAENCYANNIWGVNAFAKDHPLVSIFTPTYNTGDYLRTVYQSLRDQTWATWEWVVVDDNSSDKTWERLQEIAREDHRVRPFRVGYRVEKIGAMKRFATLLCKGKYLIELDHDDLLVEESVAEVKNAFELDESIGMVYTNYACFFEDGSPQKFDGAPWNAPGRYEDFMYKGKKFTRTKSPNIYDRFAPHFTQQFGFYLTVGPHHIRAFRAKTLWELGGYNAELPVADDFDLYARFFLRSRCFHLDKMLYLYRYRDGYGNATFVRNKAIQDHLRLARNNYLQEFHDFNQKRLLEGERNGKGAWWDAASCASYSNAVAPTPEVPQIGAVPEEENDIISFIIVDATGSPRALDCIKSIYNQHGQGCEAISTTAKQIPYEIILVGNGVESVAEARDNCAEYIQTEMNLKFAAACNLGVTKARGSYICFINDDAKLVDSKTIPKLKEEAAGRKIVGTYSNRAKPPQGDWPSIDRCPQHNTDLPMVVGLCMMMKKSIFSALGGFDPRFLTWEDDDLCTRARKIGVPSEVVGGTFVDHSGHQSFQALGLDHVAVEMRNQALFHCKHPSIKVITIAKNEASCIKDFYLQFQGLTRAWYMLDTGSDDDTIKLAEEIGVKVEKTSEFTDFADMRNKALDLFDPTTEDGGPGSWIIMMDPDERLDASTISAIPDLLFATGWSKYEAYHSRLIAVYPTGGTREFVPKPFIFRNHRNAQWMFRVHEKWVTPGKYALVRSATNSHMIEFHDKKHRNNAEDFYTKLMGAEPYFTDAAYKELMRKNFPILDYDRMDDERIDKIVAGPLISVVVPTYKRTDNGLLQKAVESVLAQTWATLEVVVVGDHCPELDRVLQAMKSWKEGTTGRIPPEWARDPRVRIYNLPQNHGAGGAVPRNMAIRLAASPWIAYLDDDNTWNPDHVEKLFGTILAEKTIWGWCSMSVNGMDLKFDRLERGYIDTSCVIHHRSLIDKHGPWKNRTEANYWHDYELFSRWKTEPQTVTRYPSVNYNAAASGQEQFLEQLARQRNSQEYKTLDIPKLPPPPEPTEVPKVNIPKLSILIAALDFRKEMLDKLREKITKQSEAVTDPQQSDPNVEIVWLSDDGTTMSVGEKRNRLLAMASGEYVAFVDDDDDIADTYVADMLKALEEKPDCVTFKGLVTTDGKNPEEFRFDMNYDHNTWARDANGVHMRCPSTWCAIKSSIAKGVKFMDIYCAEDRVWAIMLYPLLQSQVYIDKHLYFYRSSSTGSVAQQKDRVEASREIISKFRYTPYVRNKNSVTKVK